MIVGPGPGRDVPRRERRSGRQCAHTRGQWTPASGRAYAAPQMTFPTTPTPPVAEEFERRIRWRLLPTLSFAAFMLTLLGMAVVSLALQHRHPFGLPDDPDARAAAAVLAGRVSAGTNDLRWRASVLGGEPGRSPANVVMRALVRIAEPGLQAAHRRHLGDPRALAALAALDIANHDFRRAAARYHRACEMAPHYSEGRLGAGVALALEADRTPEPWQSRALRLQAIAQFAMVDTAQVEYRLALYDRALVLREAGRAAEAAFYASRYLALEDTGASAGEMRAVVANPR